jgi:putative ABC transport system permease protein
VSIGDIDANDAAGPTPGSPIGRRWTSARLGVRLARRELRRRPWRSFLVLLLVFVPTFAMAAFATVLRTTERSLADARAAEYGRADLIGYSQVGYDPYGMQLMGAGAPETAAQLLERVTSALPPGSRVLVEQERFDRVVQGDRRTYFQVSDVPLDDPTAAGRFGPVRGRLPRTPGEAVVTTMAAHDLGVGVGDTFTPDRMSRPLTVVGIVTPNGGHDRIAYVAEPLASWTSRQVTVDLPEGRNASPAVPTLDFQRVDEIDPEGAQSNGPGVFWTYVAGGVGLLVLGTIITAAFAIGARRQLRTIGLLSSTGASPSTVTWFLVLQGAVAGVVGSVAGVVAGVGAVVLGIDTFPGDLVANLFERPVEHATVRPFELLPIIVIGMLAASVAAWLPARSAGRVATLQALAGRRPLPRVPGRLPLLGGLSVGGGCVLLASAVIGAGQGEGGGSRESLLALIAIAGAVAVLLGAIATAPWVIAGLERASGALPRSWRLAGRALARNRVRSSAVVGAVVAVTATLIAGATITNSQESAEAGWRPYVGADQIIVDTYGGADAGPFADESIPAQAEVIEQVRSLVRTSPPVRTRVATVSEPTGPRHAEATYPSPSSGPADPVHDGPVFQVGITSPELLDFLKMPRSLRDELEAGGAVAATEPSDEDRSAREVEIEVETEMVPLSWFDSPRWSAAMPGLLISPTTAERIGFDTRPFPVTVLPTSEPLTSRQRDRLRLLQSDLEWEHEEANQGMTTESAGTGPTVSLLLPAESPMLSPGRVKALLLGGVFVLILAVVAVGLALAAKDSEDERQVLVAVGASPRTLRRTAVLRAVLLVLVAGVISTPAGLLPAAAIVAATPESRYANELTFRPDPWTVLFALFIVPAAVGLATWSGGRLRDLVRPARPEAFAFGD